jgi:TPR repeat protein
MSGCAQTVGSFFKPDELVLEKQWLEIRDIFFGDNWVVKQDIARALSLAAACEHKEAQWLTRVFADKTANTKEEARDSFLALGENDARGLCFADLVAGPDHDELLRRSAELGCALAQAEMAGEGETEGEEQFRFASRAASQRERDGFYLLGWCFMYGRCCEKNEVKARDNYLVAAELGHVYSMSGFGALLEKSDPLR